MATTFKAVVYADNKKKDGTYNVKIRVTHNRQSLKVSTNMFVTVDDVTRDKLKIKSQDIIDQADELIKKWRNIVTQLGLAADTMDVKQIIEYIRKTERTGDTFKLDFIRYGRIIAERKDEGTARTYNTALNALDRYMKGAPLDISSVNAKFLADFEAFIASEPVQKYDRKHGVRATAKMKSGGRAISHYLANIRHIHNEAKKEYNDEDNGVIRIPQSPFNKYTVKRAPKARKKAIGVDVVQRIINLPNVERRDGSIADLSRRDLARDCFLLSFGLAGMNAADLYECDAQVLDEKNQMIIYRRKKTRTRRADEAEMHIRIEPCIMPIVKKYIDETGQRMFNFHKHYSTSSGFTSALNIGLRSVSKALEIDNPITFYAGRHTWATIGRSNALKIDKYTIHEGLNHVDQDMKVTDIYVDRDWSVIWDANAQILGLFDWSTLS